MNKQTAQMMGKWIECVMFLTPLILLTFIMAKISALTCLEVTDKVYFVLIVIAIMAYVNTEYWKKFGWVRK